MNDPTATKILRRVDGLLEVCDNAGGGGHTSSVMIEVEQPIPELRAFRISPHLEALTDGKR